jgi:hypothetical protein
MLIKIFRGLLKDSINVSEKYSCIEKSVFHWQVRDFKKKWKEGTVLNSFPGFEFEAVICCYVVACQVFNCAP